MKTTRPILRTPASAFTTSRLLIRPMKREDLNDFHAMRTQIDVMVWTYTGKVDVDTDFTMKWMERSLPPNDSTGFSFAVEELTNPGKAIGSIGVPRPEPPEVGYMFRKEVWGKGYATEALAGWLAEYWRLPRKEVEVEEEVPKYEREPGEDGVVREVMRGVIETNNEGSRRVLRKCGFKQYGREEVEDSQRPGEGVMAWLDYWVIERPESAI